MSKIKIIVVFITGVVFGFGSCAYLTRKVFNEEMLANEISNLYLPISRFLDFNPLSDKEEYCFKYKMFKSDIVLIKKKIGQAKAGYSLSPSIDLVSKYARWTRNKLLSF